MRLLVKLHADYLTLPINYKSCIQGVIYHMMDEEEGKFYHNQGYQDQEKKYKMFVFSDLYGKYEIKNKQIIFNDTVKFYISTIDSKLFKIIYNYLCLNNYLFINNQKVKVLGIEMQNLTPFSGIKDVTIKTLSPVVAYTSLNKYFQYYKPSDEKFENLIIDNLNHKMKAFDYPISDCLFKIEKVNFEKKRLVHFKNTFYEAYQMEMVIKTNFETLKVIYDTGLSAKGSCGFGMIDCKK